MTNCFCGRSCRDSWAYSRNKLFSGVCSRYCHETQKKGLSHDGSRTYTTSCTACDATFELQYTYNWSNQRFCSKSCRQEVESRKHGKKHMTLLAAIYDHPQGLSSHELYRISERNTTRIKGAAGVSNCLKQWVRREVITMEKSSGATIYRWNSNLRPGQVILRWKK